MWKKPLLIFILCTAVIFTGCEKDPAKESAPEVSQEETEGTDEEVMDLGEYTVLDVADKVYLRGEDEKDYFTLETRENLEPGQRIRLFGEEPLDPKKLTADSFEILEKSPAKVPMYRQLYREMWEQGQDLVGEDIKMIYFKFDNSSESPLFPDTLEQKLLMELFAKEVGINVAFLPEDYEFTREGMKDALLFILSGDTDSNKAENPMFLELYRGPLAAWFYRFSMDEKGDEYIYTIEEVAVS